MRLFGVGVWNYCCWSRGCLCLCLWRDWVYLKRNVGRIGCFMGVLGGNLYSCCCWSGGCLEKGRRRDCCCVFSGWKLGSWNVDLGLGS